MNQEMELLHQIGKTDATGALVGLLRMKIEHKLAALREEEMKDWLTRRMWIADELRAQIRLLDMMLFDFELFGEHPDRTWIDHTTYTLMVVTPEERIRLHREQSEAFDKKDKANELAKEK